MTEPIDALRDAEGTPDYRAVARQMLAQLPVHWGDALPREVVDHFEATLLALDFSAEQRGRRNERRRLYPAGDSFANRDTALLTPGEGN